MTTPTDHAKALADSKRMTDAMAAGIYNFTTFDARSFQNMALTIAALQKRVRSLSEALESIDVSISAEITARFGGHPSINEDEMGKNSEIYQLLVVPRNIARSALQEPVK